LFAQPADDIPSTAVAVEPIRKPRVVLLPTNAPKFTKETMKAEHKAEQKQGGQSVNYDTMSVTKACEVCIAKGMTKAADIAKETGKNVNQVYTSLWAIKKRKRKDKLQAKPRKQAVGKKEKSNWETPSWESPSDDFDPRREPTAWEDAHMVVLKSREEYEKEIDRICEQRNALEKENAELKAVIKYLERKVMV
jgi:hypothetical protein